jgi:uncharacterized tellurite resistance protein B-like protein
MSPKERILAIGKILAAAAHADGHVEAAEVHKIYEILEREWRGSGLGDHLAEDVLETVNSFDPKRVTVSELAAPFVGESDDGKRKLLELVVGVHDADGELDFQEDAYLNGLAKALGLEDEQYQDLLLEIFEEPEAAEEPSKPAKKIGKAPKAAKVAKAAKKPAAKAGAAKAEAKPKKKR